MDIRKASLDILKVDVAMSVARALAADLRTSRLRVAFDTAQPKSARLVQRIDMEDASSVDDTLALYRSLRSSGLDNVGIVLQAYLKRTLTDIAELRGLRPSVRLCKGIYVEPGAIAFKDPDVIRRSFVACLDTLLDQGSRVAIATHDVDQARGFDRVLCLNGRQVAFGGPDVLTREVLEETYGGAIVAVPEGEGAAARGILPAHHHDHGHEHG